MSKKNKAPKFAPIRNEELHAAMFAKRSSSAASPHSDRRTKRERTRGNAKRNAIGYGY